MIICVTLLLAAMVGAVSSEHYHIVPVDSTDRCQCYPNGTCFTLDQLSSQISDTGDVTISFLPGEYLLTRNITFSHRSSITLKSKHWLENISNNIYPMIRCIPNTQIIVTETDMFTLQGLMIYDCQKQYGHGPLYAFDHYIMYYRYRHDGGGAVYLERTNAVIENCVFKNNSAVCEGCQGGALYSIDSEVTIDSCVFSGNGADWGGGMSTSNGTVHIIRSTFENNSATKEGGAISSGTLHMADSIFYEKMRAVIGGAVSTQLILTITNSTFQYNTATIVGGAVSGFPVYITASTFAHNTAGIGGGAVATNGGTITRTVYKNNTVSKNAIIGGGGAVIIFYSLIVNITNSFFEYNTALDGNGGTIASMSRGTMTISSSTFSNNQALRGGAIYLRQSTLMIGMPDDIAHSGMDTLTMDSNKANFGGAIYSGQSKLFSSGSGKTIITSNTAKQRGGGIFALQSTIDLTNRQSRIHNNTVLKDGGGIYLTASSSLIVDDLSRYDIDSNIAQHFGGGMYLQDKSKFSIKSNSVGDIVLKNNRAEKGGAIYVSDSGSGPVRCNKVTDILRQRSFKECFIQLITPLWPRQNIYFESNSAEETGSDIYGGLLDRCIADFGPRVSGLGIDFMNTMVNFSWAKKIENISQFHNHISSDPVTVCFCKNDVIDCNYTHPTVFKKKGETFTLSVVALDQVGKPVNATLVSSLVLSNNQRIERLKEGQQRRPLSDYCTELDYNVYSQKKSAVLKIYVNGPCGNQGLSKQEVNITFEPCTCPIGLEKVSDPIDCSCDCALELKQYVSNCSPENETIQVNQNVWIEYINHTNSTTKFVTHQCPVGYCVTKPVNISLASQTETDQQCAFDRTGRMCGQCVKGLSLVFASSRCQYCSNYYLFLLLPFALAGIALVAFILLLNITVATGTIHGLIFYANILAANRSIFLPLHNNFLTVFISWLNLDLGIETCFYKGMDSYGKFLLQLVFPAYVFLLIAIIMVLCNYSKSVANLFGKRNPEATLYTLMIFSFSKLIRLIIAALQNAYIDYPDSQTVFWLYDANVPYFTPSHIPRFLAALIIIILGLVYTTLLLFGQLFDHCSEYRLMKWTTHRYYIHFTKAHHAPLSDKHRYWVGLLLLVRLVHYLISAFTDDSTAILSVGSLTILLLLHKTNNQIYHNWLLNALETIFIANLSILAVASFYVRSLVLNQQALATVSMSVSFIAFLGIVLYHILDTCGVKLGELPNTIMTALRERRHNQPVVVIEERETDNYQLLVQHDDNQLREPALDLVSVQPENYNRPAPTLSPQYKEPTFTEIDIRAEQNTSM